jgi:hypothetical protein
MAPMANTGFFKRGGGAGPTNPCGTGASYPAGWQFLHTEISGGLGSWGNMLKVDGFNSFGAFLGNITDGSTNICYKNGEIDLAAADAFFTGDADVENLFDQFERDDVLDDSAGNSYIKTDNKMSFEGAFLKSSPLNPSGIASINLGSPWTMCYVLDYPAAPKTGFNVNSPIAGSNLLRLVWSGNGVDFIVRFQSPNQGYFYSGLRSSGVKLLILTYDGTSPINRSGLNLYWNGSLETPNGIYNGGSPTNSAFSQARFGLPNSSEGYFKEFDMFNFAFDAADVANAKSIYEQKYTFS